MKRALIAIASLLLLNECTPVTLKTISLSPHLLTQNKAHHDAFGFWCGGTINVLGTAGSFSDGPNDVFSGYEDYYDGGSEPFPCVEKQQIFYRGGVAFDVSQFDTITAATLKFDVERSISRNGEVVSPVPPVCNATTLGMGIDSEFYDFDNAAALPPCAPSYSIGVSSQVRDWISQSHANFGLILAGPKLDISSDVPNDNSANVTWYDNFQLEIIYNPAQNPRAPH
jgi:hypothetical protein